MSDQALEKIASLEDEAQVLKEISGLIAKEREALITGGAAFGPVFTGRRFPLLLNLGTLLFLAVVGTGLWFWYSAAQEAYVLKAATASTSGADIISALLKEAENSLAAKNKEIEAIENELKDIEAQLARLGLDAVVERKTLTDRRTKLQSNLAKAISEREALTVQVKTQTQNLEQAQGAAPSAADNALQDLMNQQELRKIYDLNLQASLRTISTQVAGKKWDTALGEIARIKTFVTEYAVKASEVDKMGALAQSALLASLETVVTAAKSGWPLDAALPVAANTDDTKKLQELIKQQSAQLETMATQTATAQKQAVETNDQLKAQAARFATLQADNQSTQGQLQTAQGQLQTANMQLQTATTQLDGLLKSFNATLGTPVAGLTGPGTAGGATTSALESIPIRIQQLQAVAAKVQEFQVLVQKQATEIESLKSSGQAGSAQSAVQISAVLTSFDQLYRTFDPASTTTSSVDTLPGRMADLQKLLLQGQDSQGLLQKATERIATMQADHDKLVAQLDKYAQLGKAYSAQTAVLKSTPPSSDRQVLRNNIGLLVNLLKQNDTAAGLFPDYPVYMNSLIESLIEVETARVKAMAQDELLAFMTTTQGKIADEQVRLLARASNAKEDTTALMTSLIKEIDNVTNSTLKDRNGKVVPKALGSVISVASPNVTVRKVSRFETFKVKRVYISRILATGDRIPIADAEIVATSGEDIILRVTSTIAPTIYPERNDLVFVEM